MEKTKREWTCECEHFHCETGISIIRNCVWRAMYACMVAVTFWVFLPLAWTSSQRILWIADRQTIELIRCFTTTTDVADPIIINIFYFHILFSFLFRIEFTHLSFSGCPLPYLRSPTNAKVHSHLDSIFSFVCWLSANAVSRKHSMRCDAMHYLSNYL